MATLTKKTKAEIDHLVDEITRKRDELRLKLHLLGMDVKKGYEKIEPEIFDIEQKAKRATEETAREVRERLVDLKTRITALLDRNATI